MGLIEAPPSLVSLGTVLPAVVPEFHAEEVVRAVRRSRLRSGAALQSDHIREVLQTLQTAQGDEAVGLHPSTRKGTTQNKQCPNAVDFVSGSKRSTAPRTAATLWLSFL